ncbi:MAG: hypothetical protein JW913_03815 [Chitinispirillaceae bacterium]|nr:hypothetical protein [Chitinispirillaceae bacterium]
MRQDDFAFCIEQVDRSCCHFTKGFPLEPEIAVTIKNVKSRSVSGGKRSMLYSNDSRSHKDDIVDIERIRCETGKTSINDWFAQPQRPFFNMMTSLVTVGVRLYHQRLFLVSGRE